MASEVTGPEPNSPWPTPRPVELEVTWSRALRVWWAVTWRTLLAVPGGALIGCVVGFVIGFVAGAAGVRGDRIQLLVQLVTFPIGMALGMAVGLWATRSVLKKQFREFRIALLAS